MLRVRQVSGPLQGIGESFLCGINVKAKHARSIPGLCLEVLKEKPITWLRVHEIPTRLLEEKAENGVSYLDAIEKFCEAGYNLIVPIDVGIVENVGRIPIERLDDFIDESYEYSRSAASKIYAIAKAYDRKVIFGVENEIDTKEWILQSSPLAGWRGETATWFTLSMDIERKYRRLNNILAGIHDGAPEALTMTNVEADDLETYVPQMHTFFDASTKILQARGLLTKKERLSDRLEDWKVEMKCVRDKLDVDFVGIDNYPNYAWKWPVLGSEIGPKTDEASRISGKPAINCEFGYTTYRSFRETLVALIWRKPSAERMQAEFYERTLSSIKRSSSKGSFPWVIFTEPLISNNPAEEGGFGLHKLENHKVAYVEPSFNMYCDWLKSLKVG